MNFSLQYSLHKAQEEEQKEIAFKQFKLNNRYIVMKKKKKINNIINFSHILPKLKFEKQNNNKNEEICNLSLDLNNQQTYRLPQLKQNNEYIWREEFKNEFGSDLIKITKNQLRSYRKNINNF